MVLNDDVIGGVLMTKKTMAIVLFPTLYILVITILSVSSFGLNVGLDMKGIMAVSLVALFPLLILIQGLISALNRINIGLSLGMSILSTMLFIIGLQADDTQDLMYSYGKIYFMFGIIGYMIGQVINKMKSIKKKKELD